MLGRFLLGLMVDPDFALTTSGDFLLPGSTDPVIGVIAMVTPKVTVPAVLWLFGFVCDVSGCGGASLHIAGAEPRSPKLGGAAS